MFYRGHGGHCCGINHIYDFYDEHESGHDLQWAIRQHDGLPNRVLEAILTDYQLAEYEPDLIAEGFVKVARWLNGSSGNYCNSYYRYKPHQGQGSIEFYGQAVTEVARARVLTFAPEDLLPPPVTVVSTEYYVLRRHKGKCGPFVSALEAAEAYPNVRQIQRREILSNGESRWSEPEVRL